MNLLRGQVSVVDDQVGIAGDDGWTLPLAAEPGARALTSGRSGARGGPTRSRAALTGAGARLDARTRLHR